MIDILNKCIHSIIDGLEDDRNGGETGNGGDSSGAGWGEAASEEVCASVFYNDINEERRDRYTRQSCGNNVIQG